MVVVWWRDGWMDGGVAVQPHTLPRPALAVGAWHGVAWALLGQQGGDGRRQLASVGAAEGVDDRALGVRPERRHGADVCCSCGVAVVVDVNLQERDAVLGVLVGKLREAGSDLTARPAPAAREVTTDAKGTLRREGDDVARRAQRLPCAAETRCAR